LKGEACKELTESRDRCLQRAKAIALFLVVVLRWSTEGIPISDLVLVELAKDAAAAVRRRALCLALAPCFSSRSLLNPFLMGFIYIQTKSRRRLSSRWSLVKGSWHSHLIYFSNGPKKPCGPNKSNRHTRGPSPSVPHTNYNYELWIMNNSVNF
jgi:hypothetical protein